MDIRKLVAALAACVALGCGESDGGDDGAGTEAGESGSEESGSGESGSPVPECGSLTLCGDECVDLMSDPFNCGACEATCAVVDGAALCTAGLCGVSSCEPGFADCDGSPANGCEQEIACEEGAACDTECASVGSFTCEDVCAPACVPPAEACNASDDDCNGECDEGAIADCRQGIHRSFSPTAGWLYTPDADAAVADDWDMETQDYYWVYENPTEGLEPWFHCSRNGMLNHYTTDPNCDADAAPDETIGYVATQETCGSIPIYELFHPTTTEFFYTTSESERDDKVDNEGWSFVEIKAYVWSSG